MRKEKCSGCGEPANFVGPIGNWICPECGKMNMVMHMKPEDAVGDTLKARDKTHGDYILQACCSQILKLHYRNTKNWVELSAYQQESLEMIAVKISRILNGDPNEPDHWHDISGYAKLVEDALKGGEDERD